MRFNLRNLTCAILAGAVTIATAPVSAQNSNKDIVVLAPDQMRLSAELNLRNGQFGRALAFADALLVRDPKDVTALLVRASVMREQQQFKQARASADAAWKYAKSRGQKYTAALLMAQALSSDGKRTRAQLWLRRAAHIAPTERHAARAARDFKYVQQRNPWQTNLSFTLAPNTNINNGSSRDSSVLLYEILGPLAGGQPFEVALGTTSRALSGIEAGFDAQTRYRFHQTSNSAHDLRARLSYRTFELSNASKDALRADDAERVTRGEEAQNVTGSDFAYGTLQLGYGYKKLRSDRRGEFSLTADLGQSFYGGARYNSYLRTNASQSYYATKTTKLTLGLSSDIRRAQRGSDQHLLTLSTGMSRRLSSGDGLYLGASLSTLNSGTERLEYDEVRLRTGYVLGREVMGTALSFGLGTSYRDYAISPHDPSGRRDFQVSAEITATLKNIDYMGFNPTVSFTASKTNSNIGLYDVNRTGISIGIASSF